MHDPFVTVEWLQVHVGVAILPNAQTVRTKIRKLVTFGALKEAYVAQCTVTAVANLLDRRLSRVRRRYGHRLFSNE